MFSESMIIGVTEDR